jgi:hypothetical protein
MYEHITVNGHTYDKRVYELAAELEFEGREVVHQIAPVRGHGSQVCTCGLVLNAGDLVQALGHLDPATKLPATTLVFHILKQGYFQVICRGCTWQQVRPTLRLATGSRRQHECHLPGLGPTAMRLRGRGDFLAAALERTGWTVAAGDPRAEAFLDRTIELTRKQDKGRINIDQVYETLRREFPLR